MFDTLRSHTLSERSGGLAAARRLPFALLALLAAVVWLALLDSRPLFRPDEGRYAEIPREMLASGDWVVPRLNGAVYVEKPPLQYWLTASLYSGLGTETWVARLVPGLAALFTLAVVGWAARRWYGPPAGAIAAGTCAAAPLFFLVGQQLTLDMLFTSLITLAVVCFVEAQGRRDAPATRRGWMIACWIAVAAAVMTKGIAALALPALALLAYSAWQRDWAVWRSLNLIAGGVLVLAIAAPWFVAASMRVPGFAQFFFIHEHFMRFATLSAHRYEPWWYFLPVLAAGTLPWIPYLLEAWTPARSSASPKGVFHRERFLWVWAGVVLIFFSLSKSKLLPYVLPAVPVLSLLVAKHALATSPRAQRRSLALTLVVAFVLLAGFGVFNLLARTDRQTELTAVIGPGIAAMVIALAIAAGVAWFFLRRHATSAVVLTTAVGWFAAGACLIGWSAAVASPLYSARDMAALLKSREPAATHIYSVGTYEQTLPFYLGRTVDVVDFDGELEFGLRLEPWRALTMADFKAHWLNEAGACAVMSRERERMLAAERLPMTTLCRDPRYSLVCRT